MSEKEITSYKVEALKEDFITMKSDINYIKDSINNIDKKLCTLPCPMHIERLNLLSEKVKDHDKELISLNYFRVKFLVIFAIAQFIISAATVTFVTKVFNGDHSKLDNKTYIVQTTNSLPVWGP